VGAAPFLSCRAQPRHLLLFLPFFKREVSKRSLDCARHNKLLHVLFKQSRRIGELGELLAALIHPHRQSYQSILRVRFRAGLIVPVTDKVRLIKFDWIGAKRLLLVQLK